jgi:uncharacterized protein YukE
VSGGSGGFEFNPEAVRGYAEVFAQAGEQVAQLKTMTGQTAAKADDFGKSWTEHGTKFVESMQMLAEDLGNLATHLGEINAKLMQGTDLTVNADTSGFQNLEGFNDQLSGGSSTPSGGSSRAV